MEESARLRKRRPRFFAMSPVSPNFRVKLARPWPMLVGPVWLAAILFFTSVAHAQSGAHLWRDHLNRQDVITALGEPNSDAGVGNNEMLMYKGGLVIQLQNGEVTDISGAIPEALKPASAVPSAAPAAPAATAESVAAVTTSSIPTKPVAPAPAPAAASASGTATDEQVSEKIISDFSTKSLVLPGTPLSGVIAKAFGTGDAGMATPADSSGTASMIPKSLAALAGGTGATADASSPWSQPNTLQGFFAGLLIKAVAMTFVLKGVFAYKDFPILWREAALVAAGVSLCNETLAWLFSLNDFGRIAGMVQADQIVAGAVLMGLITTFTAAKSFPTAAGITITAMSANIALSYAQLFFL
jgi:hypothetical protein